MRLNSFLVINETLSPILIKLVLWPDTALLTQGSGNDQRIILWEAALPQYLESLHHFLRYGQILAVDTYNCGLHDHGMELELLIIITNCALLHHSCFPSCLIWTLITLCEDWRQFNLVHPSGRVAEGRRVRLFIHSLLYLRKTKRWFLHLFIYIIFYWL